MIIQSTPPRRRLMLRIYLVTLGAMVTIAAVVIVGRLRTSLPPPFGRDVLYVVDGLVRLTGDRRALQAEVDRARDHLGMELTFYDADAKRLAAASATPPPALPREIAAGLPSEGRLVGRGLLAVPRGRGYALARIGLPPSPPGFAFELITILACLAVASLITARMIGRPLETVAAAARAFGRGDLAVRTRLNRRDEIGDVAHAFDEMAERITRLLATQRELLASISHELRTPLARIRVALDLAAEGDAEAARRSLRNIDGDLEELEGLVRDVLAMARMEAQSHSPHQTGRLQASSLDARAVVESALVHFRAAHSTRPVQTHVPSSPVPLEGDASLLRRVVENLLDNADKYSPPGAVVRVALIAGAKTVRFEVEDHGHGIDEADLPFIFDPFFRADRSRSRETGGTGLGLSLSKRIVDAHGGTIRVDSRLDRGTRVVVTLNAPRDQLSTK